MNLIIYQCQWRDITREIEWLTFRRSEIARYWTAKRMAAYRAKLQEAGRVLDSKQD